jgi:uncharacterized protein (DUF2236 family)
MTEPAPPTAYFMPPGSIVRQIWGDADVILLIFAGSAAEFAVNKAVDWLFFTGKLPADPIGRMFSTVRYAQALVFQSDEAARRTIGQIAAIHTAVEQSRHAQIPAWAYRDVLYMLIDYAERAYTLLYRPLTPDERAELFTMATKVGEGMQLADLPATYPDFVIDRARHLANDLAYSDFSEKLLASYRAQLGGWRYELARQVQAMLVPAPVRTLLGLNTPAGAANGMKLYALLKRLGLRAWVQRLLMPGEYLTQVQGMDRRAEM